jgi:hypothetical protein
MQDYDGFLSIFVSTNTVAIELSYSELFFLKIKLKYVDVGKKISLLLDNINHNEKYRFSNNFMLKTI